MINRRLLSKLQVGKKYTITDGISFYILDIEEDVIWCRGLGFYKSDFFGVYMKDWEQIISENRDDSEFCSDIEYIYNKNNPTYIYYASISKLCVYGRVDFRTYDIFFLGEYKEDTDTNELKRYCDIFKISYRYYSKKERLQKIYAHRRGNI